MGRHQPTGKAVWVGSLVRVMGKAHFYSETELQHAHLIIINTILKPKVWFFNNAKNINFLLFTDASQG